MKTKTIFRKFHTGEIIALFPELAGDCSGFNCLSYMSIGQHSSASVDLSPYSVLAKPDEYSDLKYELERIGYEILPIKRSSRKMQSIRFNQIVICA